MICIKCQQDNPLDVKYCLTCGTSMVNPVQKSIPSLASNSGGRTFRDSSIQALSPKPFPVVFSAVVTFTNGIGWLLLSTGFISVAASAGAAGAISNALSSFSLLSGLMGNATEQAQGVQAIASFSFALLNVMGILAIVASLGIWTLAQWARRLTAGVQVFSSLLGMGIMLMATKSTVQTAGLSGFCIFMGAVVIAYAAVIVILLLRPEANRYFLQTR